MAVMHIYNGTSWVTPYFLYPKIYDGTNWVAAVPKLYGSNGSWYLDTQTVTVGSATSGGKNPRTYTGYVSASAPVGVPGVSFGSINTGISSIFPTLPVAQLYYEDGTASFNLTITGATNTGWSSLYFGSTSGTSFNRTDAAFGVGGYWSWSGIANPFGLLTSVSIIFE